jgi:hypothetical protein
MLEQFIPKNIFHKKVRLGPRQDGGYVFSDDIFKNCQALLTYGVGQDIRFECDFIMRYQKPSYLFDHTIGKPSQKLTELLEFFNEGLGFNENCSCVISHYENLKLNGPIVLKIDTEGAEYDYFEKVDLEKLANFTDGIILEIHWISKEDLRKRCFDILEKLSKYYVLFHIHGNNWGNVFDFEGHIFPDVLELSFAHKRLVKACENDQASYPISGLDFPNHPYKQDYSLAFLNKL